MPRLGRAHTLGVSAASFEVGPDGRVEGRLAFATTEALAGVRLDRNRDGVITADDVASSREDLKKFVLDGVDVTADGAPCPATFERAELDEIDGLVLQASYRCPSDVSTIGIVFYYLTALPAAHREVARIVAGPATAQAVLSGRSRAIELQLPTRRGHAGLVLVIVGAVVVAASGLVLTLRRRRATS